MVQIGQILVEEWLFKHFGVFPGTSEFLPSTTVQYALDNGHFIMGTLAIMGTGCELLHVPF